MTIVLVQRLFATYLVTHSRSILRQRRPALLEGALATALVARPGGREVALPAPHGQARESARRLNKVAVRDDRLALVVFRHLYLRPRGMIAVGGLSGVWAFRCRCACSCCFCGVGAGGEVAAEDFPTWLSCRAATPACVTKAASAKIVEATSVPRSRLRRMTCMKSSFPVLPRRSSPARGARTLDALL